MPVLDESCLIILTILSASRSPKAVTISASPCDIKENAIFGISISRKDCKNEISFQKISWHSSKLTFAYRTWVFFSICKDSSIIFSFLSRIEADAGKLLTLLDKAHLADITYA
jgi:hypothetical protein